MSDTHCDRCKLPFLDNESSSGFAFREMHLRESVCIDRLRAEVEALREDARELYELAEPELCERVDERANELRARYATWAVTKVAGRE